jgi:hypothetical protein
MQVGALKTAEYTLLAIAVATLMQTRHSTLLQHFLVRLAGGSRRRARLSRRRKGNL